jgi:hypothetical protein
LRTTPIEPDDDHIGGRVFHPFRLPEVTEQRLFDAVQSDGEELDHIIASPDAAKTALAGFGAKSVEPKSGPALIGGTELLVEPSWVASAASFYAAAFAAGVNCRFPPRFDPGIPLRTDPAG